MTAPFLWGAATAGHQIEGNNVNADIWLLEQVPGTLFVEPSGDACDSLNRWREDLALVRAMGLNACRFSVEWSRVEPQQGRFSLAWLDHYRRIAEACRAANIAPVVTLSHFTSPRWFAQAGGWDAAPAPDLLARFTDRVARHMGEFVSHVLTFNEPNLPVMGRWMPTPLADPVRTGLDAMLAAAAVASGSERFSVWVYSQGEQQTLDRLLDGHRAARAAWKAVRPETPLGFSMALPDAQPVETGEGLAAYRRYAENPFFAVARDDDFVAIQTYGRLRIGSAGIVPPPPGAVLAETGDEYYPEALGNAIRHAHAATGKAVFVTENGIAARDDGLRCRYLPAAIASMQAARRGGVPMIGYCHWSLLDNFEWRRGYTRHFGLVAVDRTTFRRAPKPSARIYAGIAKNNR